MTKTQETYIYLYRSLIDDPILKKPVYFAVWIFLLLKARYRDAEVIWANEPVLCKRGQFVTTRGYISKECRVTENKVRSILSWLEKNHMLTVEATKTGTMITISNYDKYQAPIHGEKPRISCETEPIIEKKITNEITNEITRSKEYINKKKIYKKKIKPNTQSGLEILQEFSPVLFDGLKSSLEDRAVVLNISKSSWKDIRSDYELVSIKDAAKKAIHWIADQYEIGNSSVKDLVLRSSRLLVFLKGYPKVDPTKRKPGESLSDYVDRVGINSLITN